MKSWAGAIVGSVASSIGETSTSVARASVVLMGEIGREVAFAGTVIVK